MLCGDMPIYVDHAKLPFRDMYMSHMTADTLAELHDMAEQIGMKLQWFQHPPHASFPHYDIPEKRRDMAIALGAIHISERQTLHYAAKLGIEWVEGLEYYERKDLLLIRYQRAFQRSRKYVE